MFLSYINNIKEYYLYNNPHNLARSFLVKYYQKIYFGMPGTGKSHEVHENIIKNDLNVEDNENIINTVFHPEYSYGDFMGKLLPITNASKQVEYNYYEGFNINKNRSNY